MAGAAASGGAMTEAEYIAALAEVWALMDAAPDSEDERRLVELSEQVAEYEMRHHPMGESDA